MTLPISLESVRSTDSTSSLRSLPVIDRALDNTALSAFLACPKEYDYAYVQHMRPKGRRIALDYGSLWHSIMEWHYKTDGDETLVYAKVMSKWKDAIPATTDHRTVDRAWQDYDLYRKRWGATPSVHEEYKTIGWLNLNPLVEMAIELDWPGAEHPYTGRLDRICENAKGEVLVEDHKTNSRDGLLEPGGYYFRQFELDNQLIGYTWLARLITGKRVAGVRINAYGVLKTKSAFGRDTFRFSDEFLEDWEQNYNVIVREIKACYQSGVWRRNFRACSRKYGACSYVDICKLPPRLRDRALQQECEYRPWNPLEQEEPGE
jgi:hypothetical protein